MGTRTSDRSARARRSDPPVDLMQRIATLEAELQACRTQAAQTERLRRVGTWSLDPATGTLVWSDGTRHIFGLAVGEPVTLERALSFYSDEARATIGDALAATLASGAGYDVTVPFTDAGGKPGWLRTLGQVEAENGEPRLVGVVEDVTVEKLAQDRLRDLAHCDPLTGLWNRRAFQQRLEELTAGPRGGDPALFLIDVDQFKAVNDAGGHAAGDRLLEAVAGCLRDSTQAGDVVARVGGDEFAVIFATIAPGSTVAGKASELVEAVRALSRPGDLAARPSVSIGAARSDNPGDAAEELLRCADLALYRAKALGRDRAVVYSPELREQVDGQARVLREIRDALGTGCLVPVYQPIVDLRTGLVRGVEALARWNHPVRGVLPPSEFAAALADPVLSMQIDEHVLRTALAQMRAWLDEGVPAAAVNVNMSESQLRRPDLVDHVTALLAANDLEPEHLKLEVLETALLGRDTAQVSRTVARLAERGTVCVLDDFGTGYASLAHLREFRVERFKIDRSFVANIVTDPFDRALTRSLIELGHNLGIRVTAEGVETVEQLALLKEFGCDCAQGYLVGRPTAAADLPELVTRWHARYAAGLRGSMRAVA